MSNEYGFFASKEHDRRYSADDFSAFFGDFFTNGVLGADTNSLKASAVGDMNISIASGTAYINGHWYRKESSQVLSLSGSDKTYDRVDAVVIRCDLEKRMVYPFIIEGEPAEAPEQPLPVRNEKCYDLVLAYIDVAANCVEVTEADITDKRGFDDVCGFVTSAIDHIDTTGLFEQYNAQWELLKAGCAQDSEAVIAAWNKLVTVKTINGLVPTEGEVRLTQSLIPSDGTAYQMPYYVQSGTVTTTSTMHTTGLAVSFKKAYKTPPLLFITAKELTNNTNHFNVIANYRNLTATGFVAMARFFNSSGSLTALNSNNATQINWFAIGQAEV